MTNQSALHMDDRALNKELGIDRKRRTVIQLTTAQLADFAEQAVETYIRKVEKRKVFPTKTAAARYLKVTRQTVSAMVEDGRIKVNRQNQYEVL